MNDEGVRDPFEEARPGAAVVPGFAQGGVVRSTGIALVHEGEYIVPAPGSEARIDPIAAGEAVSFHFPVDITVVGGLTEEEREAIEARVFERLADALERVT